MTNLKLQSDKERKPSVDFNTSQLLGNGKVTLSRESGGIRGGPGQSSWSRGERFGRDNPMVIGQHSPSGKLYFKSNDAKFKGGRYFSLYGRLKHASTRQSRQTPGPATYSPNASAAKKTSPLEGPDYCTTTIKWRTKTAADLNRDGNINVGPGSYKAYKPLGAEVPAYSLGMKCMPTEKPPPPKKEFEKDEGMKPEDVDLLRHSTKGTFSQYKRFVTDTLSQSPNGSGYYRPNKLYDTINKGQSSSLGCGQRIDYGRLTQSPGPAAYKVTAPIPQPVLLTWDVSGKAFVKMKKERLAKKAYTTSPKSLAKEMKEACPESPNAQTI